MTHPFQRSYRLIRNRFYGSQRPARAGWSLLEITIVIAILATISLLAWPSLSRPLSENLITGASQKLVEQLGECRTKAIEKQRPLFFYFEVNGPRFILSEQAWLNFLEPSEIEDDEEIGYFEAMERSLSDEDEHLISGTLPEGVVFIDTDPNTDGIVSPLERLQSEIASNSEESGSFSSLLDEVFVDHESLEMIDPVWSKAILFRPTGRLKNHQLNLMSRDGMQLKIELLSISGSIRIQPARPWNQVETLSSDQEFSN